MPRPRWVEHHRRHAHTFRLGRIALDAVRRAISVEAGSGVLGLLTLATGDGLAGHAFLDSALYPANVDAEGLLSNPCSSSTPGFFLAFGLGMP